MKRRLVESFAVAAAFAAVVVLLNLTPAAGQDEPAPAEPVAPTSWGEPDLQGLWTTRYDTPLQRPARFAEQEFFTDEERAALDSQRTAILERDARPEVGNPLSTGGAYNRAVFLTHKETGRRTSLIVDPPDGRMPPYTEEAQQRRRVMREYQLALLQATDTCKDNLSGCAGGTYGSPSPRREETPPVYFTGAMNRADGPEDRNLGERCLLGRLPDFGGAAGFVLQIIQSPGAASIFYDTGQGQGWQRAVQVTDRPHLPAHLQQWRGDSRARWEGETLVVDVTNFTPKNDFFGSRENLHLTERWTRLDEERLEYVVTIEDPTTWTRPWTVALELAPAGQRGQPALQGAALPRRQLRPAGAAGGRTRRRTGARGRTGPPSGKHLQRGLRRRTQRRRTRSAAVTARGTAGAYFPAASASRSAPARMFSRP